MASLKSGDMMKESCVTFCKKYLWEGQKLSKRVEVDPNAPWHVRHKRFIGIFVPALIVHFFWWSLMISNDWWYKFNELVGGNDKPRHLLTVTMVFGSMVAGATSEGGASVAFPVMTLALDIKPAVARDFSFMIQSIGMTAAAFSILWMKVHVEWHSILYCSISGTIGIIFGLELVAPAMDPPESKMFFVCIWFAFAFSLYWLNRLHDRRVFEEIPFWEDGVVWTHPTYPRVAINWKACVLLAFGFLGGIFSAMAGSGIDICSFACLTLLFRVSEKVATPTSVILMSINTCVGFYYREVCQGGVEKDAWNFLIVCVPVVVIGAPLGSAIGSHFHRLALASCVYLTDTVQLIGALYVVEPWLSKKNGGKTDDPVALCVTSGAMVVAGAIFFKVVAFLGLKLLKVTEDAEAKLAIERKLDMTESGGETGDSSPDLKKEESSTGNDEKNVVDAEQDGMKQDMADTNNPTIIA